MAEKPSNSWRTTLKRRLAVGAVAFAVGSAAIEARLVYLQVFQRAELAARAEQQQSDEIDSAPRRGEILDRDGRVRVQYLGTRFRDDEMLRDLRALLAE